MAPPRIHIPPETLARARALFENGASLQELAVLMGVSDQTVRNRAIELGWSRVRRPRPVAEVWPDAPPPVREPAPEDLSPKNMRLRLQRMVAREMLRAETYNHSPAEAARTLASLSRTVMTLNAMDKANPAAPEEDDFDIDEFRRDLTVRLEAIMDRYADEAARMGIGKTGGDET